MKIHLISIIILILVSNCKSDSLLPDTIKWSDEIVKNEYHFKLEELDLTPIVEIYRLKIHDTLLIIAGRIKENDCLVHFYHRKKLMLIKSMASTGRGPEEYSRLPIEIHINQNSNELSISDISFRITRFYNLDSVLNGYNLTSTRDIKYSDIFGPVIKEYNNGEILCMPPLLGKLEALKESPDLLSLFNHKTQSKLKSVKYPSKDKLGLQLSNFSNFRYALGNSISVSPKGDNILIAYRFMDLIEIYDKGLNLIARMQGPDFFTPKFEPSGDGLNIKELDSNRHAFENPVTSEDEFWVHYSGDYVKDRQSPNRIYVFDWNGKLKRVYRSENIPVILDIDSQRNEAYGVSRYGSLTLAKFQGSEILLDR